ncbi:hypothetical protein CRE_15329 [Caenorhabditis remanei]|uniref:Uncharacterized protein n=1 Tax=Caenorhabditis remanei TaxID=31234 RepID=E3MC88_CAERE|nr:hypothetical protein CRE_15329 [Caenorhabditis remanei]
MERSFEESYLQEEEPEVSPPLITVSSTPLTSPPPHQYIPNQTQRADSISNEENHSARTHSNQIPETPILTNPGGNRQNQGSNSTSEKISDTYFNTNFRNPRVQQLFDNTSGYSNQQSRDIPRYPNNADMPKHPEHSAFKGQSQDARNTQNTEINRERSRIQNNEHIPNHQRLPQSSTCFSNESIQQSDSVVNNNIEAAIRQHIPATCELCSGQHHLSACSMDKKVLMRYCATTARCMECTSLLHTYHNCPLRLMKKEDAERQLREKEMEIRKKEMELRLRMNSNSAENHSPAATLTPRPERAPSMNESFLPEPKKKSFNYQPNQNQRRRESDEESEIGERNRGTRFMSSSMSRQLLDHFRHCTPFSGDKSYYPKFRSLFNNIVTLGDTDLDIARDILLEKVTGQAAVHRSMLTDAKKAILITFHNLDKVYMDRVSVTSLVRELESVRVPYDTSANLTHYLGVARQLYDQIHEADPNFFTYHHTLSLLARMPYPVRQECALRRENGSITPEYVFDKADSLLSEMLADEELTGICPDPKLKHQAEKTSINTVTTTTESDEDDSDSSNESKTDTQESEVFAYNGKREKTYNNSHKQRGNNHHQNGNFQPQYSNNKNLDINVNPFTQNQNQPQVNNTDQSQQQAPVQQTKVEPKQGFNQFDMNGAPSPGAPTHQYPEKSTLIPDGTPDCPGHAEGRQLTIKEALRTRIVNCKNHSYIIQEKIQISKKFGTHSQNRMLQIIRAPSNRVCTNCRGRHSLNYCKSDTSCYYCNGRHNTAACKLKEFFRDYRNFPAAAPKPTDIQFFLDQQQH